MELGDIVTRVTLDATQFSDQLRRTSSQLKGSTSIRKSIEDQFDIDSATGDFERNMLRIQMRYRDTLAELRRAPLTTQERGDLIDKATASYNMQIAALRRADSETRKTNARMAASFAGMSKVGRSALTQLAFATDDFIGVYQNSGSVGAAIRATSNNIGTLVTMINPLAGIATTVAMAFGSSLIPKLFDTGEEAQSTADKISTLNNNIERYFELRERGRAIGGGEFDAGDVKEAATEMEKLQMRQKKLQAMIEQQRRAGAQGGMFSFVPGLFGAGSDIITAALMAGSTGNSAMEEFGRMQTARGGARADAGVDPELRREMATVERDMIRVQGQMTEMQRQTLNQIPGVLLSLSHAANIMATGGQNPQRIETLDERDRRIKQEREEEDRERKRREREEEQARRKREQERREQAMLADQFRDAELDVQSQLLTGKAKREFDINRRFDEQRRRIFATAPDAISGLLLSQQNEAARQKALQEGRTAAGGPQFAGQFQRGSAEAFSEILRASGVADDQAKKAAKATADNTKKSADNTKAIADALRTADSLLLIPSLGGAS